MPPPVPFSPSGPPGFAGEELLGHLLEEHGLEIVGLLLRLGLGRVERVGDAASDLAGDAEGEIAAGSARATVITSPRFRPAARLPT
jgi:hypothetical protein